MLTGEQTVPDNKDTTVVLNWYEIEGNSLIGEETLQDLTVDDMLELFNAPFWNKVYHCWSLEKPQIAKIKPYARHIIDPEKYAYFIEVYKI